MGFKFQSGLNVDLVNHRMLKLLSVQEIPELRC